MATAHGLGCIYTFNLPFVCAKGTSVQGAGSEESSGPHQQTAYGAQLGSSNNAESPLRKMKGNRVLYTSVDRGEEEQRSRQLFDGGGEVRCSRDFFYTCEHDRG